MAFVRLFVKWIFFNASLDRQLYWRVCSASLAEAYRSTPAALAVCLASFRVEVYLTVQYGARRVKGIGALGAGNSAVSPWQGRLPPHMVGLRCRMPSPFAHMRYARALVTARTENRSSLWCRSSTCGDPGTRAGEAVSKTIPLCSFHSGAPRFQATGTRRSGSASSLWTPLTKEP